MGKASRKRQKGRERYLANIAISPEIFASKWDSRVQSWLNEINLAIAEWKRGGNAATERIFNIVDIAMKTLEACGPEIYGQYAKHTYELLCNDYCAGVAGVIDRRLYRLSNFDSLQRNAGKSRDGYSIAMSNIDGNYDQRKAGEI